MQNLLSFGAILVGACALTACSPPPPVAYDGLDGISPRAVTVILGAPLVDSRWDEENGPLTWRKDIEERYQTPRRIFRNGRWIFDGYTSHEFLLTCDLTAILANGQISRATLTGAPRACEAIRADAEKVAALIDVLQESGNTNAKAPLTE